MGNLYISVSEWEDINENNYKLHEGCTIGRIDGENMGSPVFIGINAMAIGNVCIENDVLII